ncbi:hypothetical protein BJ742DRAFT_714237 [Cladochytrium replicatum]|nr:hypothetical protein BJ742DRAFT_714237 [Cladochytrium replicatum]
MIASIDGDSSGTVEFSEFLILINERGGNSADSGLEQVWEAELSEAFEAMDVDGDGLISVSDLSAVLSDVGEKNVTNEEVADMLREADADGDGFVGFEDFCKMLLGTIILK